jgi:hypothetical protein
LAILQATILFSKHEAGNPCDSIDKEKFEKYSVIEVGIPVKVVRSF